MSNESRRVDERRTARLRLRRPMATDVPWMAQVHSDPANYAHAPDRDIRSVDAGRAIAEEMVADWEAAGIGYWLVEHDGEPIGMLGLKGFGFAGRPAWNLYYRFVAQARGRGLALEAGGEALAVAAMLDPSRPVVARTRPTNAPAQRLARALGLQRRPELDADDGLIVYASR